MNDSIFADQSEHTLLLLTASELEEAFRNILSELLDERERERKAQEKLNIRISRTAAAKRLNKNITTLYRWEQAGMLHPIHIGRSVYYTEREIQLIEQERR